MSISFTCDCGKQLKVADAHAGKRAKCPACGNPVTVPAAPQPEAAPESDEDAAFRALAEGPDPVPTNREWRAPDVPNSPRPPAARTPKPPETKRPIPKPKKSEVCDPYAERGRKWNVDWGQIGGGIVGVVLGTALLLIGLANNRFFIWSPFIILGGAFGILNGLFNVSRE